MIKRWICAAAVAALGLAGGVRAADNDVDQIKKELDQIKKERAADRAEMDSLKKDNEALKKQRSDSRTPIASAQANVENKYGPNSNVTTKQGRLTIGGLVQVWYYSIQNDTIGFFGDQPGAANDDDPAVFGDTNELQDNDSFAIRRAQLRFTMDIHENVTAVVMIDPARAIQGRPSFPTNAGLFKRRPNTGGFDFSGSIDVRTGEPVLERGFSSLEEAYINFHGIVPHHDFTVGQYRKFLGEEGIRNDASLDFVERSMIGQTYQSRDLGLTAHGTWWDDRFQYWLGVFNDGGNWYGSNAFIVGTNSQQNRVDDNDQKSFTWRVLVRPLWKNETWGSLEIGASGEVSHHGEAGRPNALDTGGVDGLNLQRTRAMRYQAWACYRPGGPVKGWWLKGEWGWMNDRNAPFAVIGVDPATGFVPNDFDLAQRAPNAFSVTGFYVATGYKISDSVFKDSAPGWLKNFEFAFRYEQFDNIQVADLVRPNFRTDVFATDVWTAGINYYIKGDNAKIQLNYFVVDNPDAGATVRRGFPGAVGTATGPRRNFHAVDNNSLVVNFQVAW